MENCGKFTGRLPILLSNSTLDDALFRAFEARANSIPAKPWAQATRADTGFLGKHTECHVLGIELVKVFSVMTQVGSELGEVVVVRP